MVAVVVPSPGGVPFFSSSSSKASSSFVFATTLTTTASWCSPSRGGGSGARGGKRAFRFKAVFVAKGGGEGFVGREWIIGEEQKSSRGGFLTNCRRRSKKRSGATKITKSVLDEEKEEKNTENGDFTAKSVGKNQCHYCDRTASSRWYKNKTQCNACYNRARRIRIKNDLQTHSCEMCQTSSSVEWYRNKFVGGKTGRLCHSCYCRERATALDVRCAQCQNERTSGNWAIPKNKGKFKHGDRLCNACYRRELVSLKVEARGEGEKITTSEGGGGGSHMYSRR
jgi:hypothetical protein